MPKKSMKPCKHPGCPLRTNDSYCEFHARLHVNDRPNPKERGYDNNWRVIRKSYLNRYPLCEACLDVNTITPAVDVHHIIPLAEGGTHNDSNLMSLCHSCHSKITRQYKPSYSYKNNCHM